MKVPIKTSGFKRLRLRLMHEESGFTLAELLVTISMLTIVLFALYGIFDMSLRVFSVSNDKTESNQNARVALERMEREIRMAYPANAASDKGSLLCAGLPNDYCAFELGVPASDTTKIAFGNDLNHDGNILNCTGSPATCTTHDAREIISYYSCDYDGDGDLDIIRGASQTCTSDSSLPALADLGRDGSMTFSYFTKDGSDTNFAPDPISTLPLNATTESSVEMVRVKVNVRVDRGPGEGTLQTLTTDVTLRNRNR